MDNPFIDFNKDRKITDLAVPTFKKNRTIRCKISEEAFTNLQSILLKDMPDHTIERKLEFILEAIGLGAIQISQPFAVDPESNTTTDDCRQSGFEDAMQRNSAIFLKLFGGLKDDFQIAYMRGYLEGHYIRTKK